jgi:hypothetical protein
MENEINMDPGHVMASWSENDIGVVEVVKLSCEHVVIVNVHFTIHFKELRSVGYYL